MNSKTLLPLFVFVLLIAPVVTLAQFKPLVGIPGISDPNTDFNTYINTLYFISISVAGLVAVIKIIIAGVKWMLSDLVTSKQDAKSDIQGALIGLLIIISAVLILEVINPQLTQTKLFLAPVDTVPSTGSGSVPLATAPKAPLPPPVLPINKEEINCVVTPSGYDCTTAEAACEAKNGDPESIFMTVNKISCVLGEVDTFYCAPPPDPASYADCTEALAKCPSSSVATLINDKSAVSCYTPNP